ncbi:MAG: thiol:disulfide interchange protein, partial [Saprospiraceae bacterium]
MKRHVKKFSKSIFLKSLSAVKSVVVTMSLLIGLVLVPSSILVGQITKRGPQILTEQHLDPNSAIKWLTMEQAYKASRTLDKPIFIDVYTSWCGWCKRMDQTTFRDPVVANYINTNFYPVKFNA